jgi:hypothetical protein
MCLQVSTLSDLATLSLTSCRLIGSLHPPRHGLALDAVEQNTMRNFEVSQFRLPELNLFAFPTTSADEEDTIAQFIKIGQSRGIGFPID